MSTAIADNALIGDLHTAALVANDGTIDFMCLPDFDSDACFASILGTSDNGMWKIAPLDPIREVRRRYRGDTLILETELVSDKGTIRLIDFMPVREGVPRLVRIVEGVAGELEVAFTLRPRFGNGCTTPRVTRRDGVLAAVAGSDAVYLTGGSDEAQPFETVLLMGSGDRIAFVLSWARPHDPIPSRIDPEAALAETERYWNDWTKTITLPDEYGDLVMRSLITVKACSYRPSGAIVAAPTFGLPETPGGERNWDYRFCWIRDSVLTLAALMSAGHPEEAVQFGEWLNHVLGGNASQLQIMYGIHGERQLTETTLDWLPGHEGARPVRVGNGAYNQFQLDVYGELAAAMYVYARLIGHLPERTQLSFEILAKRVAEVWKDTDHGIWEMRGPKQAFTASRVAAWSAIDCWVRVIEEYKLKVDRKPWEKLRLTIFDDVCTNGFDVERDTFTQYYGSKGLDASLLVIPMSGFLPPDDVRVVGTVRAIEKELLEGGLVLRYRTEDGVDGLSGEEGAFLACSFWLANTYHLMGRHEDARRQFERTVKLANDVGLLAEEYLVKEQRQSGNFPQAVSHLALVNSAYTLFGDRKPVSYVGPQL